ncbi:hypothetical protein PFLU3_43920 [Pseudomonas fluorescens]|uniref:Uncharacterized protein n=1 Tax=Pseudomonas fluorescens TaxID=294 RepID=A0A0D0TDL6_PSEFL|nr:hypothetical protein PFLU3_43920 [Pseudomonas fluorescens]
MLVVHALQHQALPLEEVAGLEGVQGMQLINLGAAGDLEGQRLGAFEVHIQVAAQHAAAQFQANKRADIGLGDPQIDVLGGHFQFGADGVEVNLTSRLDLALLAQAGVDLQGKGALVEAVEVLHIDIQWAKLQRDRRFGLAIGQVHLVVTQLHVLEQHLPGFARGCRLRLRGIGSGRRSGRLRCRGWFARLAGEQFLPIQLPIGFTGRPGFQLVAANLADNHLLLGQVYRGFADVQALQAGQWPAIRRLDCKGRDAGGGVGQVQFGFFGQAEFIVGAEVEHTVFQHQGQGVTYIGPPGFHLAVGDFQGAFGCDRHQAEITFPVDLPTVRARGDQSHVGVVFGQGTEVFQLEVEFVVKKFDGFAGAQVLEVQVAARQLDAVDTQWERLGIGIGWGRLARWQLEQLRQVKLAGFVEQQFGLGLVQLHIGQVQGAGPETVHLQVGVEALETHLFFARLTDLQAPQCQFEAERVELDALDSRWHRGVVGQLLVGNAKGNAR